MTSDESEVPLVGRVESADIQLVLTRTTGSSDRRIEDWIASNLDLEAETPGQSLESTHRQPAGLSAAARPAGK